MKLTLGNLGLMERTYYAICDPINFNLQQCMFVEVKNFFHFVKWGVSSRWSFRPNSACGSIEKTTIGKTRPTLVKLDRSKKMSIWQILKSSTGQLLNKLRQLKTFLFLRFFTTHMDIFHRIINYYSKLIACFFYGYALGVAPMGMFADVFGARYLIGLRQILKLSINLS